MPRLPSTSWAPRPTRASKTRVFTELNSESQGTAGARGAARQGERWGSAVSARESAVRTATGADTQQVDVDPLHEEHRRRRHGLMSTRSVDIRNEVSQSAGSGPRGRLDRPTTRSR